MWSIEEWHTVRIDEGVPPIQWVPKDIYRPDTVEDKRESLVRGKVLQGGESVVLNGVMQMGVIYCGLHESWCSGFFRYFFPIALLLPPPTRSMSSNART